MTKKGTGAALLSAVIILLLLVALSLVNENKIPDSTETAVPVTSSSTPIATGSPISTTPAGTAVPTLVLITKTKVPSVTPELAEPTATGTVVPSSTPTSTPIFIIVEPGDTLSQLYLDHCGSAVEWPVMCDANGMLRPYSCHHIYPGMKLKLVCKGS